MAKRIILFSILILGALFLFSSASALTEAERQAMIAQLQQQIAQLQAQLAQLLASPSLEWCHTFNSNIKYGNLGTEVAHLHIALQREGFSIASNEVQTQSYYDSTTYAVNAFQEKYASEILWPLGLTQGTGFVGALTRAKLNQLYGCAGGENPPPTPCTPGWYCTAWSVCANGLQTRTCTDYNNCGTTTNKPITTQTCTSTCTPGWYCTAWSTCANNTQTRNCTDYNNCGTTTGKPATTQSCTSTCTPNWACTSWSTCSNGQQTRTCTDANNCGATTDKPATTQSCSSNCTPNWACTSWSTCSNGLQTRSCTDANNCGVTTNQPMTSQSCTSTCTPNWSCGTWGSCSNNQQARTCTDLNNCGTTTNKPATTQACSSTCSSNWSCIPWSVCLNNQQTRTCTDLNNCTNASNKPATTQACDFSNCAGRCCPNWSCNPWSTCVNKQQTRICVDLNSCGSTVGAPAQTRVCTTVPPNCVSNWGCSDWGYCVYPQGASKGEQVRSCFDLNLCTDQQVVQKQDCTCTPTWDCTEWSACANGQHARTCTSASYYCINPATKPAETEACVTVDIKAGERPPTGVPNVGLEYSDGPLILTHAYPWSIALMDVPDFYLSWTSTGATSCTANPGLSTYFPTWTGSKNVNGSEAMSFSWRSNTLSWTFGITCAGPAGTATDSVVVIYVPYISISTTPVPNATNILNISWYTPFVTTASLPIAIQFYLAHAIHTVPVGTVINPPAPKLGSVCQDCSPVYKPGEYFAGCEGNSKSGQCLNFRISCPGYIVATYNGLIVAVYNTYQNPLFTICAPPVCTPSWSCPEWSVCTWQQGQQTRTCTDLNSCGDPSNKPTESQSCTPTCVANWQCTVWGPCNNSQLTRTCTDLNYCGDPSNKPSESQPCVVCTPNWECTPWGACGGSDIRLQERDCYDSNNCGVDTDRPATTQYCL